jgi:hypothetical protein
VGGVRGGVLVCTKEKGMGETMALLVTVRKAVLPHSCDTCGQDIAPGKHYIRLFYTRDEGVNAQHTYKECRSCSIFTSRVKRLDAVASGTVKPKPRKRYVKLVPAPAPALATGGVVVGGRTVDPSALVAGPLAAGLKGMADAAAAVVAGMPAAVQAAGRAQKAISVAQAARQRAFGQAV